MIKYIYFIHFKNNTESDVNSVGKFKVDNESRYERINIGDFGKNNEGNDKYNFYNLIKEIENLEINIRFRISSIEPNLLTD